MEFVSPLYEPFPDPRLELTLVNEYLHQLGKPRLRTVFDAHEIFDEQRVAIETILSSEKGRDTLLPNLVKRPNTNDARLSKRRADVAERLAVLFDPEITLETVAKSQSATVYAVRTTLMGVFRRSAVVGKSNPELLDGALIPFDKEALWQSPDVSVAVPKVPGIAPRSSLRLVQDPSAGVLEPVMLAGVSGEAKTRLEHALETLHVSEQEALALFLGLDGQGRRTYKEIARRFEITRSSAQRWMWAITARLRDSGDIAALDDYLEAMRQEKD